MKNSKRENNDLHGFRLDDIIKKQEKIQRGKSRREQIKPFENQESPGGNLDQNQRVDRVFDENVKNAFFFFAETYFSEYVTSEFCQLHYDLVDIEMSSAGEFHLVAAPPEHGKSVILLIWKVFIGIRGLRHKHAQISEDKGIAHMNIGWVEGEFKRNYRILHDFGNLIYTEHEYKDMLVVRNFDHTGEQHFSGNPFTGYKWFGHQTTLKGFIFYQYRIDSVEFDDYEPIAKSKNKSLVEERIRWIFSEVEGRTSEDGVMIWIHNNSRKGSAADRLHDGSREKVFTHKYPAHDGQWNPLWPERYTGAQLKAKKMKIGTVTWMGDWMQEPIIQGKIFTLEQIKAFADMPEDLLILSRIDTSSGSSKQSSFKALVVMGWSPSTQEFYVLDAWVRQTNINNLVDACYHKYNLWVDQNLLSMKIEADFRQDLIYNPYFQMKAKEKGYRVPIGTFEVKGLGDKDSRVSRCESPMNLGIMNFPKDYQLDPDLNELVQHILAWDYGGGNKRLDGADAWATCYHDLYKISLSYTSNNHNGYEATDKGQPRNI